MIGRPGGSPSPPVATAPGASSRWSESLDLHTAGELTTAVSGLLQQKVTRAEVDAGGLSFADLPARAVLMAACRAQDAGATFGVTVVSASVERLIEITGLSDLLVDHAGD